MIYVKPNRSTDLTERELMVRNIQAEHVIYKAREKKFMKDCYLYAGMIAIAIVTMLWG
jgi:hypothetical protein